MDVTLSKLVDTVKSHMLSYRLPQSDMPLLLDERLHWKNVVDSSMDVMPRSRVLHGGRVAATYTFADMGELDYHSEVSYTPTNHRTLESLDDLNVTVVEKLRDFVRGELDCQVCYNLILDPLTTSCGHTFCRQCVARVLDHSNLCPVCRRRLPMAPGVQAEPSNKRISYILQGLLSEQYRIRRETAAQEEAMDDGSRIALFPCTLSFPSMPTFLHIFEPRYRLMIRRSIENGSRRFGIMMYNHSRRPQGSLGNVQFMQYGTLLHIQNVEIFPDGRSLIETRGLSRFRILDASMVDGYMVGHTQRIDDISLAEEEAIEARETSGDPPPEDDVIAQIQHMSTQRLLQYGLDFIGDARSRSADWLAENILAAYGQPPTDPATFPYWFASVLPIAEDEKFRLLPTTSVRERLKITARWIQRLEAQRW